MNQLSAAAPIAPDRAPAPAIVVRDVSHRLERRWVLAHVSFELPLGDSLLVIGPNGAGKTTLLRLVASATAPSLGSVSVLGLDVVRDRDMWRRRTGLLSHANYLYEDLSAEENLMLVARTLSMPRAAEAVAQVLDRVGLSARRGGLVRTFSAGMRKRVSMARILLKDPDIVLLDEPFGELDPAAMTAMEDFAREFLRRGKTIVLVTHHVEHGRTICRRTLALRDGRVESST